MDNAEFPHLTPVNVPALTCHKRFHDEHVAKRRPPQPFSRTSAFDRAVHKTLKNAFSPSDARPDSEGSIASLARRAVHQQNYPEAAEEETDALRCAASVAAYLSQTGHDGETVGVEVYDSLPVHAPSKRPLVVGATYNRLVVRAGAPQHLTLVDYRTGAPGGADITGACIMLAIASRRFKDYATFTVEYHYLGAGGLATRQTVTSDEARKVWPALKARALRVYSAGQFPAELGSQCAFCRFQPECWPDPLSGFERDTDELDDLFE